MAQHYRDMQLPDASPLNEEQDLDEKYALII